MGNYTLRKLIAGCRQAINQTEAEEPLHLDQIRLTPPPVEERTIPVQCGSNRIERSERSGEMSETKAVASEQTINGYTFEDRVKNMIGELTAHKENPEIVKSIVCLNLQVCYLEVERLRSIIRQVSCD